MNDYEVHEILIKLKEHCKNTDCNSCQLAISANPYICAISLNERGQFPRDWVIKEPFRYRAFENK